MAMSSATASRIGGATVVSHCTRPVYYHVSGFKNGQGWDSETEEIPAAGLYLPYDTSVSVKLFHKPGEFQGSISQLEFNLDADAGRIWYDISNVDAFRKGDPPFMDGGMSLTTLGEKDAQYPTCTPVHCPRGQRICKNVYNLPDDPMTKTCPQATSLYLVLCPDADIPPPVGEPEEVGWTRNSGSRGYRLALQNGRPTKSVDAGRGTKTLRSRDRVTGTVMIGGLTWQVSGSDKSYVAKLPALGLVAGLACYFLIMF